MGSQRRREAIAAGLPVENAEAVRRRRRAEASILRETIAIEMWARGATSAQISQELFRQTGVKLSSDIPALVRRGLFRRVEEGAESVEIARELFREYYKQLLATWMPRALERPDPDNPGEMLPPDPRALDGVLRILREYGVIERVVTPPRSGDINLNVLNGVEFADPDMRAKVLASLAAEREKQMVIEGTLAGTPAAQQGVIDDDGKTAPPILPKRPD